MRVQILTQQLMALMQDYKGAMLRRILRGVLSSGIVPLLIAVIIYAIMWRFMKKAGRFFLAVFLVLLLAAGFLFANGQFDHLLNRGSTPGYSEENTNLEATATLPTKTDDGSGTQLSTAPTQSTAPAEGSGGNNSGNNTQQNSVPTQATNPPENNDGTANDTGLPTSDNYQAILGDWYQIMKSGAGDGFYDIELYYFSDNYYFKELWTVSVDDWDRRIPNGGFGYFYATVGNTIYYQADMSGIPDDDPVPVGSRNFSVNGDTLTCWDSTFTRGRYEDAIAVLKQQYGDTVPDDDTVPNDNTVPDDNTVPNDGTAPDDDNAASDET